MIRSSRHKTFVYIGSFFGPVDEGLRVYRWDHTAGTLEFVSATTRGVENPLYLATDPQRRVLYVADCTVAGAQCGAVSAHAIDGATGALTWLNRRPSGGAVPVHLNVSACGRWLLAANCGPWAPTTSADRTVVVLGIRPDGRLAGMHARHAHAGAGADPVKQTAPHPHALILDPANRYAFAPDLGIDRIVSYRFDARYGTLALRAPACVSTAAGSGPRQFRFHPSGRFAYLIIECASTIIAYAYDSGSGRLTELQTVSALPAAYTGERNAAELCIHPSGQFLYGSNRGHDSIAIFAVDQGTGTLTPAGHAATHGRSPRAFAIDPTGGFLLVANESSDNLVSFHIDRRTGRLEPTGHRSEMPHPACIAFVPLPD